jgi:hypothetical protein
MPWDGKLEQAVKLIGNFSNRITVMMLAVLKKLLGMLGKRKERKDEGRLKAREKAAKQHTTTTCGYCLACTLSMFTRGKMHAVYTMFCIKSFKYYLIDSVGRQCSL